MFTLIITRTQIVIGQANLSGGEYAASGVLWLPASGGYVSSLKRHRHLFPEEAGAHCALAFPVGFGSRKYDVLTYLNGEGYRPVEVGSFALAFLHGLPELDLSQPQILIESLDDFLHLYFYNPSTQKISRSQTIQEFGQLVGRRAFRAIFIEKFLREANSSLHTTDEKHRQLQVLEPAMSQWIQRLKEVGKVFVEGETLDDRRSEFILTHQQYEEWHLANKDILKRHLSLDLIRNMTDKVVLMGEFLCNNQFFYFAEKELKILHRLTHLYEEENEGRHLRYQLLHEGEALVKGATILAEKELQEEEARLTQKIEAESAESLETPQLEPEQENPTQEEAPIEEMPVEEEEEEVLAEERNLPSIQSRFQVKRVYQEADEEKHGVAAWQVQYKKKVYLMRLSTQADKFARFRQLYELEKRWFGQQLQLGKLLEMQEGWMYVREEEKGKLLSEYVAQNRAELLNRTRLSRQGEELVVKVWEMSQELANKGFLPRIEAEMIAIQQSSRASVDNSSWFRRPRKQDIWVKLKAVPAFLPTEHFQSEAALESHINAMMEKLLGNAYLDFYQDLSVS